jgi:hypothetical protein
LVAGGTTTSVGGKGIAGNDETVRQGAVN